DAGCWNMQMFPDGCRSSWQPCLSLTSRLQDKTLKLPSALLRIRRRSSALRHGFSSEGYQEPLTADGAHETAPESMSHRQGGRCGPNKYMSEMFPSSTVPEPESHKSLRRSDHWRRTQPPHHHCFPRRKSVYFFPAQYCRIWH